MYLKTNPIFPADIQEGGCLFFSLLYLVEQHLGKTFSPSDILTLYDSLRAGGTILPGCYVQNHNKVLAEAGAPGIKIRGLPGGLIQFPATYQPKANELLIGCYFHPKTKFTHFVVLDANKKIVYDSMGQDKQGKPISKTIREGYLASLRVYQC